MYNDHLRLIGKRIGDFLLVLIELFSLGRMAEALRAIIGSKSAISLQRGLVDPKFQVEGVALNHFSSQKTRLNDLLYCIKIWTDLSSVSSQCMLLNDRQILIATPHLHSMQCCKNGELFIEAQCRLQMEDLACDNGSIVVIITNCFVFRKE